MQFIFSQWVRLKAFLKLLITLSAVLMSPALLAHGVAEGDKGYIQEIYGVHHSLYLPRGKAHGYRL